MSAALRQLDWDAVVVAGAIVKQETASGIRLARLPDAVCQLLEAPMLSITAAMAAGIRLGLQTD
eukprot:gene12553-15967_t